MTHKHTPPQTQSSLENKLSFQTITTNIDYLFIGILIALRKTMDI